MHAKASLKTSLSAPQPEWHLAAGPRRAWDGALQLAIIDDGIELDPSDVVDVSKRPSCTPDLKPTGRYVAKDLIDAATVPLLMKIPLDHGFLRVASTIIACASKVADQKGMERGREEDVIRMAFKPPYCAGEATGPKASAPPERALVNVAGMSELKFFGRARCLDPEAACVVAKRELKFSQRELDQRRKGWKPRAPEFTGKYLSRYAQRAGVARDGAIAHPTPAAEKACHADV